MVGKPVSKGVYICPDAGTADTEFFKYTAGGSPTHTITGFEEPIGSVVASEPPPPNPPAEILISSRVPCTYGSQGCPTDFEIDFTGNITALIPSTDRCMSLQPILSAKPRPERSVSADRDVRYDVEQNNRRIRARRSTRTPTIVTVLAVSRAFIMASCLPEIRLRGCGAYRKPRTGRTALRYGAEVRSRRPVSTSQPAPIISIASKQPLMSGAWKYAIVFVSASTQATGTASYGSWWAIGYVPRVRLNRPSNSGIREANALREELGHSAQPARARPTLPVYRIRHVRKTWAILATENSVSLPPPGTSGSPFTRLSKPPKVLKPYQ